MQIKIKTLDYNSLPWARIKIFSYVNHFVSYFVEKQYINLLRYWKIKETDL